jgi:hypothetical protein
VIWFPSLQPYRDFLFATAGQSKKRAQKQKAHVDQHFWHVGFGISLCTEVLGPQQPQARNVQLATATAVAATTQRLARHFHFHKRVRAAVRGVNGDCAREKPILANNNLDAGSGEWLRRTEILRAASRSRPAAGFAGKAAAGLPHPK